MDEKFKQKLTKQALDSLFSDMNIPWEKQEPEIVITIQDNNSKKPWEVKHLNGTLGIVIVLDRHTGAVDAGIVGSIAHPAEVAAMLEAVNETAQRLANVGHELIEKMEEH